MWVITEDGRVAVDLTAMESIGVYTKGPGFEIRARSIGDSNYYILESFYDIEEAKESLQELVDQLNEVAL